mmetsp:Transcript_131619/g.281434  ORF Transcript_131619/g.281434 Transcript_131619/m.281434 type:complete len:201 (+) Transcript_131619:102-704(+)
MEVMMLPSGAVVAHQEVVPRLPAPSRWVGVAMRAAPRASPSRGGSAWRAPRRRPRSRPTPTLSGSRSPHVMRSVLRSSGRSLWPAMRSPPPRGMSAQQRLHHAAPSRVRLRPSHSWAVSSWLTPLRKLPPTRRNSRRRSTSGLPARRMPGADASLLSAMSRSRGCLTATATQSRVPRSKSSARRRCSESWLSGPTPWSSS